MVVPARDYALAEFFSCHWQCAGTWRVETTPAFTAQALAGGSSMCSEKQRRLLTFAKMRGIVWVTLVVSCHTLRIAAPPLALRAGRSTVLLAEKPEAEADLAAAFAARLERLEDSAREEETQLRDQRDAELRAAGVSRARQAWGYTTEGPEPEAAVELSGLAAGACSCWVRSSSSPSGAGSSAPPRTPACCSGRMWRPRSL